MGISTLMEVDVMYASAIQSGYGHKRITVDLIKNGKYLSVQGITSDMPGYDEATDLEGREKHKALYKLIEHKVIEEVELWLSEIE